MIEPLRFNEEHCPVYSMERPVFCEICRFSRAKKNNPNVADKFCPTCVQKQFLCSECDHQAHRVGPLRLHMRRIIVLGHGVRKVTKVRGDGVNFPLPMDKVEVILVSKIYHDGKEINREPPRRYQFMTGLSGLTMHVQVRLHWPSRPLTRQPRLKSLWRRCWARRTSCPRTCRARPTPSSRPPTRAGCWAPRAYARVR